MQSNVDHLVFASRDLEEGIQVLYDLSGIQATPGGSHPGIGTCNANIALGNRSYFEIIAPDPDQPDFTGVRPFGIDDVQEPVLAGWAVAVSDMSALVEKLTEQSFSLSDTVDVHRQLPSGEQLHWQLCFLMDYELAGIAPFFIDWKDAPHPSEQSSTGLSLEGLCLSHPVDEKLKTLIAALKLPVEVKESPGSMMSVSLKGARGKFTLKSV